MPFSAFNDILEMPQAALHNSKLLNLDQGTPGGTAWWTCVVTRNQGTQGGLTCWEVDSWWTKSLIKSAAVLPVPFFSAFLLQSCFPAGETRSAPSMNCGAWHASRSMKGGSEEEKSETGWVKALVTEKLKGKKMSTSDAIKNL